MGFFVPLTIRLLILHETELMPNLIRLRFNKYYNFLRRTVFKQNISIFYINPKSSHVIVNNYFHAPFNHF